MQIFNGREPNTSILDILMNIFAERKRDEVWDRDAQLMTCHST